MEQPKSQIAHIIFLPYPSHGHVKPMLKLAELFSHAGGFQVTFLNTQNLHDSLLLSLDLPAFNRCHPQFEFLSMPEPPAPVDPVPAGVLSRLHGSVLSLATVIKPAVAELLVSIDRKKVPTCIIADGFMAASVVEVAEEFRIPFFALRTSSACCIWTYFHLENLIEAGDFPFQDKDMDKLVTCIPGLENVVRRRDLPGILRIERANDPTLEAFFNDQTSVLPKASGLILNTFEEIEANMPHILIFPFPAQGHIKPMLCLAELLCQAGLQVTFLNTRHNHRRLNKLQDFSTRFPTLHFESISDGLPEDHPRNLLHFMDLVNSIKTVTKSLFRDLLISLSHKSDVPPVSCIIADGIMSFAIDVAEKMQIKVIIFRTISACCLWSYLCVPKFIDQHDRPYSFGSKQLEDPNFQFFVKETQVVTRASAVILNTFDTLESPVLSQMSPFLPKIYTIGPLHALWKTRIGNSSQLSSSDSNLREANSACMTWLDLQPLKSVIYVSFGSYLVLKGEELLEFWHGLKSSDKPFLWVLRQDNNNTISKELGFTLGTMGNGFIIDWAPQEEVLAHKSVGGFLTHCGWNSSLESMVAGVPMICWPKLPDQLVNSKWMSEVWKIGIDMKDICDRTTVEKMVRALMEDGDQRQEIMRSVDRNSKLASESVSHGGSSFINLDMLIEEIKT
ncbi:UDP-glucuronosyl/UDP-glucosyltransferase [Corchorus olitorius]|uniref:UDP-glucuronosyl/UDP-glucosyltransferase n=1 Tax=Corchorus olitorius TaxID=93759 RepID=A0A1R3JR58_9ROSI|nr:UDP-glucuronosyl/UDP-glucosyltransferase [Corchorus olitorius]